MTVIIEHGGYVAEDQNGEEEEEKQNIKEVKDIIVEEDRNEEGENNPDEDRWINVVEHPEVGEKL